MGCWVWRHATPRHAVTVVRLLTATSFTWPVLACSIAVLAGCIEDTGQASSKSAQPDTLGFPVDPIGRYHFAVTRALSTVDRKGEIAAYFRALPASDVAARSQQLAVVSVTYLDDAELAARYTLLAGALRQADTSVCAGVGRRTISGEQYASLIGSMPAARIEEWATLMITGMRSAVRDPHEVDRLNVRAPTPLAEAAAGELGAALMLMKAHLPQPDRARFEAVLTNTSSFSDGDACWLQRTIYGTAARLGDGDGSRIRAALATAEAASPFGAAAVK